MTYFKPAVQTPPHIGSGGPVHRAGWVATLLGSNRVILGVALVLGLLVPEYFHRHVSGWGAWFAIRHNGFEPTVAAAAAAIIMAHLSLRRVSQLPLIATKSLILPTFMMTYGASIAVLYMLVPPFGRFHLWTSFCIAVTWYFLVAVLRGRLLQSTVAMIGGFEEMSELFLLHINWLVLTQPCLYRPVSAVMVDPHATLDMEWSGFITRLVLDGVPVYHRTHLEEGMLGRVRFQSHADNNFGALLPSLTYVRVKRLFDLGFLLLSLPIVLLLLLVAAIAIKIDSPGPIFFRQTRMGYRGRPFTCYKLRSMYVNGMGPSFTLEGDTRVTRVGRFIRKWRIDELPQVLNILKGEMSWVGPRPEALDLALEYELHVPFYAYRHAVRPGITGWAAVHQGNVAQVEAARLKLEYDFYYIKYFSFWLDFLIFLKTAQTIWNGFGAK